jgi:anti-sigma factor RsiW
MDKADAREQLPLLADGELDETRAAELRAWVDQSPKLREELERWVALRDCACRGVRASAAPADLKQRVLASISGARSRRPRIIRLAPVLAAIAAMIALAIFLRGDLLRSPARNSAPPAVAATLVHAGDFASIHQFCAVDGQHNEYATDDQKLASARESIRCKMNFTPVVPDLSDAGFDVQGCCGCFPGSNKGLKAAHVFYRDVDQNRVVSFFALNQHVQVEGCKNCARHDGDARPYAAALDGDLGDVVVLNWNDEAYSYAVVGRMKLDELRQLANRVDVAALLASQPAFASRDRAVSEKP